MKHNDKKKKALGSYNRNIAKREGLDAVRYRLNLNLNRARKLSKYDLKILYDMLHPIVVGVVAERDLIEFKHFDVWKAKFRKAIAHMDLLTGVQTDIFENYKRLKHYESQMKALGFNVGYFNLSPKLVNVTWYLEPSSTRIKQLIKTNSEYQSFFADVEDFQNRISSRQGRVRIQAFSEIPFDEDVFGWPYLGDSIAAALYGQLLVQYDEYGKDIYDYDDRYSEEATAINLIRNLLDRIKGQPELSSDLLGLLYDCNLTLAYLPADIKDPPLSLAEQARILFKKEKFTGVPEFVLGPEQKPFLTEVFEIIKSADGSNRIRSLEDEATRKKVVLAYAENLQKEEEKMWANIWEKRKT